MLVVTPTAYVDLDIQVSINSHIALDNKYYVGPECNVEDAACEGVVCTDSNMVCRSGECVCKEGTVATTDSAPATSNDKAVSSTSTICVPGKSAPVIH